jgi:L-alanine-DL-glutamate epimerase-like enolase superfamily enzyme
MRITDVEAIWLRVPGLSEYCEWGEDAFLVRVHTDEGIVGVGESDSSPAVLKAIVETPASHSSSRGLREILIGEDPLDIARLWRKMFDESSYLGRRGAGIHAISAIDIALWDIASQKYGVPIHQLLGGKVRDAVPAYGTFIPDDDPAANRAITEDLLGKGFGLLKVGGAKFGLDPEHDEDVLSAIRGAGDGFGLAVDLVYRWRNFRYAQSQIERFAHHDLAWVEEPLPSDDHEGLRRLSDAVSVPISGGEPLTTYAEFSEFVKNTRPDIVQPDLTRAGGITETLRVAEIARQHSVRLVPHGFSTGILLAATVQFLAALPDGDLIEFSQSTSPLSTGLVTNPFTLEDGAIRVPDRPGLGVELDEDMIDRYRVETNYRR